MRKLKFADLDVAGALFCPNPTEFYSKAYLTEDIADNYRTLPGIKYKTEIATTTFTNILSASTCTFDGAPSAIVTIPIDVCAVSAMAEICRFDLEQSFVSEQMVKGSNGSYEVASFMNHYWGEMAKEIEQEIEVIRWKGDTAATGGTFVTLCDGYEKQLAADAAVVDVVGVAITPANVLAEMAKVYAALAANAPALINRTADLRFYIAANVAAAFRQAVAAGNANAYLTKNLDLTYLDIKIVVAQGMTSNKMVLTLRDNMIYAFDGEGDAKALKAIDLSDTVAEPKLRTRTNIKIGFKPINGAEIIYYA